jgi:twitching motility protein PilU
MHLIFMLRWVPPPVLRGDSIHVLQDTPLDQAKIDAIIHSILTTQQRAVFDAEHEFNMSLMRDNLGRFRINIFRQRQMPGLVIRKIVAQIPTLEQLKLPPLLGEMAMKKRGLVLVVGGTGSGKSTTLAAMIGHRNHNAAGHIITIEDPIEFVHDHAYSLITQREVGVDTISFQSALKNALRQKPDVILIGEIRDQETMEMALKISETGHLCLATLHANNANQAIDRILNFFPLEFHPQLRMNLSLNLLGILSQRLVANAAGGRAMAQEVMLNEGLIRALIRSGDVAEIKKVMADNVHNGMQTFDQCLINLVRTGEINEDVALAEADNASDMKLALRQMQVESADGGLKHLDTSRLTF